MKKTLFIIIIVLCCIAQANISFAMLKLSEVRSIYPEYNDLTDYELSTAVHRSRYAQMDYAEFAREFGGPLFEKEKFAFTYLEEEYTYRKYIDKQENFSIFYINSLIIDEKIEKGKQVTSFNDNDSPFLTVKIEHVTPIHDSYFSKILDKNISGKKLVNILYGNNEFISNCSVTKTFVQNIFAIRSKYCYRINNLENTYYVFMSKIELIKGKYFYKVEFVTPLCESPNEAIKIGQVLEPLWEKSFHTFTLL